MALNIQTFTQQKPSSFFKALGHPKTTTNLEQLKKTLESFPELAIYDPQGWVEDFLALTNIKSPIHLYKQDVETLNKTYNGIKPKPITFFPHGNHSHLLLLTFDEKPYRDHIQHLLPTGCEILSLESCKLPLSLTTDQNTYLTDLNFATNFAFFREQDGWHTRIATANYWHKYGSKSAKIFFMLFDERGSLLHEWEDPLENCLHSIIVDSQDIKKRFNLPSFTGQLFIHVIGAKGHSIVKYALDTYHDDGSISATHDANAWPSLYSAGLPAPDKNQQVILWLQNSHPIPIPTHQISFNIMGESPSITLPYSFDAFETKAVNINELLPNANWPQQIEIETGHYFVRPRYEVINQNGYRCIAHVNVERTDLKPDLNLSEITKHIGKGFILPSPILPMDTYTTSVLPTPMAREQKFLPLKALIYDKDGALKTSYSFGNLPRNHSHQLILNDIVNLNQSYGHVELVYDFDAWQEADGWLHGLVRYKHKNHPSQAETSFGSHIFNTVLTYKNEPQSYKGAPPGLTTGLFLRLGTSEYQETFCHLIYPISQNWHALSDTQLILYDRNGHAIDEITLKIPASGSCLWFYHEEFSESVRKQAQGGYIIIQDKTCRLFGYHGLRHSNQEFSLDHMFGF